MTPNLPMLFASHCMFHFWSIRHVDYLSFFKLPLYRFVKSGWFSITYLFLPWLFYRFFQLLGANYLWELVHWCKYEHDEALVSGDSILPIITFVLTSSPLVYKKMGWYTSGGAWLVLFISFPFFCRLSVGNLLCQFAFKVLSCCVVEGIRGTFVLLVLYCPFACLVRFRYGF